MLVIQAPVLSKERPLWKAIHASLRKLVKMKGVMISLEDACQSALIKENQ